MSRARLERGALGGATLRVVLCVVLGLLSSAAGLQRPWRAGGGGAGVRGRRRCGAPPSLRASAGAGEGAELWVPEDDEDPDGKGKGRGLSRFFRSSKPSDFRSDTVTRPSFAMRRAMFRAEVGDDVWGDDPTVTRLEQEAMKLFGKEAAVFVSSGTQANLIALLSWCDRGDEFICGDKSHVFVYEQASAAQFGGCSPRTVANLADGTLDLDAVRSAVRPPEAMNHFPRTKVLCLENTHNLCGGRVLPLEYMRAAKALCEEEGIGLHLDGARLFNAAESLGVRAADMGRHADSISICLSKGLGAPVGSILLGPPDLIARARRLRKALGGGMRQAGVIAAPGLLALTRGPRRLREDHELARLLAEDAGRVSGVSAAPAESNIVLLALDEGLRDAEDAPINAQQLAKRLSDGGVLVAAMDQRTLRLVTHCDVTVQDAARFIDELRSVLGQIDSGSLQEDRLLQLTRAANGAESAANGAESAANGAESAANGAESAANAAAGAADAGSVAEEASSPSFAAAPADAEPQQGRPRAQRPAQVDPRCLAQVALFGVACSADGFIALLLHEATGRALRVGVTPPDPMLLGLDVSEPESEQAITVLQLVQGMDLGGDTFPLSALAAKLGVPQSEPPSLNRITIFDSEPSAGLLRAELHLGLSPAEPEEPSAAEAPPAAAEGEPAAEAEGAEGEERGASEGAVGVSTGFETVAFALRHEAPIFVHRRVLGLPYPLVSAEEMPGKEAEGGGAEAEEGESDADSEDVEWSPDTLRQRLEAGAIVTFADIDGLFPDLVRVKDFEEIRGARAAAEAAELQKRVSREPADARELTLEEDADGVVEENTFLAD